MASVSVSRVQVGPLAVNCYLAVNPADHACVIIDPGDEPERIIAACEGLDPKAVLLTHAHFDHIGAADAVCARFCVPLYLHEADAPKLTDPVANAGAQLGFNVTVKTKPVLLRGGETLPFAGLDLTVLHTPGHSAGGVCYLLPEGHGVFTGDTLFADGYGRTDFIDGDFGALMDSLRMLLRLTPRMTAWPGHGEYGFAGRNREENA